MNIISIKVVYSVYNILSSFSNTSLMSFQANINTATKSILKVIDFFLVSENLGCLSFEIALQLDVLADKSLHVFIILSLL